MFDQKNSAELHTWVEKRLSDFIDQQLAPSERARMETHLADCARCRASFESMRWTVALVKQAPAPTTRHSFALPVPARRAPSSIAFGFARFATALATLLLFAVIGVDLISQFGGASAPAPAAMRESAPTRAVAFAATQTPEPPSAPKPAGAQSSAAPPPPAPANVPPAAPTPSAIFRSSEVSPTQSAADMAQKSQGTTQPARAPAIGGSAPFTTTITATTTSTPTQTATIVPPTATLAPTPTPAPTPPPVALIAPMFSVLRVAQVALLFAAIFFGMLMLLLWRRK